MLIELDYRESDLYRECELLISKYSSTLEKSNLPLGDIKFENVLIERKTLNDLAASIKDGRYKEQSFRLQKAKEEGFRIYYFIEGNMDLYLGKIPKETLITSIFSLTLKGFNVISTRNVKDSALYLMQFVNKWSKGDYSLKSKSNTVTNTTDEICKNGENAEKEEKVVEETQLKDSYVESSVTKKKNSNITVDNISVYMLCQIPGISTQTAGLLLDKYGHISNLIREVQLSPMTTFTYEKDGKTRKLNKTVLGNLNRFLRLAPAP
jgi:crossover junction endonuclease MUS81